MKVLMDGQFPAYLRRVRDCQLWSDKGMSQQDDLEITFCIPKPWGDEDQSF